MPVFVSSDEKRGTTTIRHSWRIEVFSEFGEDPLIRAHREQVVYDTDTEELIQVSKDSVVQRSLSDLPDGPRRLFESLATLMDQWESEDQKTKP